MFPSSYPVLSPNHLITCEWRERDEKNRGDRVKGSLTETEKLPESNYFSNKSVMKNTINVLKNVFLNFKSSPLLDLEIYLVISTSIY